MGKLQYFPLAVTKAHKSASRVLGYALHLSGFTAWDSASAVWAARLSDEERAALAYAAALWFDGTDNTLRRIEVRYLYYELEADFNARNARLKVVL